MTIEETLKERGSRYGSFKDNAQITQGLMDVLKNAPKFNELHPMHKEAFHMIFHKIARCVCGDIMYVDNAHDIVGYAKGLENYLIEEKAPLDIKTFFKDDFEEIDKKLRESPKLDNFKNIE